MKAYCKVTPVSISCSILRHSPRFVIQNQRNLYIDLASRCILHIAGREVGPFPTIHIFFLNIALWVEEVNAEPFLDTRSTKCKYKKKKQIPRGNPAQDRHVHSHTRVPLSHSGLWILFLIKLLQHVDISYRT